MTTRSRTRTGAPPPPQPPLRCAAALPLLRWPPQVPPHFAYVTQPLVMHDGPPMGPIRPPRLRVGVGWQGPRGWGAVTLEAVSKVPPPLPLPVPLPTATRSPAAPRDETEMESPEETGQGVRETQGEVTGQGRLHSPKNGAERRGGAKERTKGTESLWSCRCAHRRAQVSAGVGKPPHGLGGCIWSTARATARLWDSRPPE